MPNRIIRESARTSATLFRLSDGAERMFWRLTTVADDYGRFEADPRILKAQCFPLWGDRLKIVQVGKWYAEMEACELVTTYVVTGKVLGFFNTWDKHQRTRAKESKYPAPSSDNICRQPLSDVAVVGNRESRIEMRESDESRNGARSSATLTQENCAALPESLGQTQASGRGPTPTQVRSEAQPGAPAPESPTRVKFSIPDAITSALNRAPRLGAVTRLRYPDWWQAVIRANRGVDFPTEVLRAEAYLVAHPQRHYKDLGKFLHGWMSRADRSVTA